MSRDIKYPSLADYAANPRSSRKKRMGQWRGITIYDFLSITKPEQDDFARKVKKEVRSYARLAKSPQANREHFSPLWQQLEILERKIDEANALETTRGYNLSSWVAHEKHKALRAWEGVRKNPPYYFGKEMKKLRGKRKELDYDYDETDERAFLSTQPDLYDEETTGTWSREQTRRNPSRPRRSVRPPGVPGESQAIKTFEGFNEYPSKGASKFAREIVIPERMPSPGPCRWVTYRSDKWNNGTHDYIHTITSYPRVKCAMAGENYETVKVPAKVRNATTLTQVGLRALGFAFEYDDDEYEASVPAGTEWFWSQTARALYLIQNKRKLIAVIWGGKLNVEPRGIVG
jgi:hypothetical protein